MDEIKIPDFSGIILVDNVPHTQLRIPTQNTSIVSDGYHTFGELYEHRILLFLAFLKALNSDKTFCAKKHHDGGSYDNWFLVCTEIDGKQISYYVPDKYWQYTGFMKQYDVSPIEWDGHSSYDVLDRLLEFVKV